ncbi:MAG: alkaline phosphatase family protein [Desulfobacterales bacterium]|nr:alkaline phosphatase family protein [Desulfobacterales bacterium]MDD4071570.1 alkaline phosphatase family protein [Desulfobacterales bacterium]MDD4391560.1 alkaline phosphatase family protein [Desulfobacterales bacterium]
MIMMISKNDHNPLNPEKSHRTCILIILDGLGDRAYEQLGGKTPLQAAYTPVLDSLCEKGSSGLYHASMPGQALPSEHAHFMIFGYDMSQFPGRGVFEALGAGIELESSDVAVLAHFASVEMAGNCLVLKNRKPRASEKEIDALIREVGFYETGGVKIRFYPTGGIRGILRLEGNVSPFITDTDPILEEKLLPELLPWAEYEQDSDALNTAVSLKSYLVQTYECLNRHPVNIRRKNLGLDLLNALVTQRAGQCRPVTPFDQKYGLAGLSIASGIVYHGLSRYIGMDCIKVSDSGDAGKDLARRLCIAQKVSDRYDFIHVHTKTPDEAAHKKDPEAKRRVIESLDRGIGEAIGPLLNNPDVLLIITSDHSTPSSGPLIHSGEPSPLMFFGTGVRRDRVKCFDEISVAGGALGTLRGRELMYMVLNYLDYSKLCGLMDTPENQPYWPGNYQPLRIDLQS